MLTIKKTSNETQVSEERIEAETFLKIIQGKIVMGSALFQKTGENTFSMFDEGGNHEIEISYPYEDMPVFDKIMDLVE